MKFKQSVCKCNVQDVTGGVFSAGTLHFCMPANVVVRSVREPVHRHGGVCVTYLI